MNVSLACKDWLFRGDHPIVRGMSFQVYAMWVFILVFSNRGSRSQLQDFDYKYDAYDLWPLTEQ